MGTDGRDHGRDGNRTGRSGRLKKAGPAERLAALEAVCEALAHPARRQILIAVAVCGGAANAGYIARRFDCAWPTVTRHLRVLEKAGLLVPTKQGRERLYRLNSAALEVLDEWLSWLRNPPPSAL